MGLMGQDAGLWGTGNTHQSQNPFSYMPGSGYTGPGSVQHWSESMGFYGKVWASGFALGRTIPMGNTIRSVVMGSVDPLFDKRSSLYKSRVQLKIGFEIGSFRKIKKEVKELIPMDKLKDKGDEKVEYYLKDVGEGDIL